MLRITIDLHQLFRSSARCRRVGDAGVVERNRVVISVFNQNETPALESIRPPGGVGVGEGVGMVGPPAEFQTDYRPGARRGIEARRLAFNYKSPERPRQSVEKDPVYDGRLTAITRTARGNIDPGLKIELS